MVLGIGRAVYSFEPNRPMVYVIINEIVCSLLKRACTLVNSNLHLSNDRSK